MAKESISASIRQTADIAKVVLMPGDPLRAKYVAEHYLENPVCFNTVRNMLGYTGTYKGKQISVMGSGMGIPSFCIYAVELYTQFDVDAIIRIGSAGGVAEDVKLGDVIIAMGASTNSAYGDAFARTETGGAWLSSARVVRCWVKSRNERNPYFQLLTGKDRKSTRLNSSHSV